MLRRYNKDPKNVAAKYPKTMRAKEYTWVFNTGVNARAHTTSMAMDANPVENRIHLPREFRAAFWIGSIAAGDEMVCAATSSPGLPGARASQPQIRAMLKLPAAAIPS